jgi:hypothetical protein
MSKATNEQMKEGKKAVREMFLAALMLSGANGAKYNDLKRGMKENFVMGTSMYPESLEAVLQILNAYVPPAGWNMCRQEAELQENKEQCLLRPAMEETTHGSQGRPVTNVERRGTSHGSVL